jgi:hypothetical protein
VTVFVGDGEQDVESRGRQRQKHVRLALQVDHIHAGYSHDGYIVNGYS